MLLGILQDAKLFLFCRFIISTYLSYHCLFRSFVLGGTLKEREEHCVSHHVMLFFVPMGKHFQPALIPD